MAKESKTLSINPSEEQSTVEFWQDFGWELVSSQEIFNQHQEQGRDSQGRLTLETKTTNYVKLVFSRDTTIENHDKIVALEKKLPALPNKMNNGWAYTALIALIALFASVGLTGGTFQGPFAAPCLITCAVSTVLSVVLFIKAKTAYNSKLNAALAQRNAIRLKAKEFLK